jgi:hypothetical protein
MKACGTVEVQPNSGNSSLVGGVSANTHTFTLRLLPPPPPYPGKEPPMSLEYEDEWEPDAVWRHFGEQKASFSLPRVEPPFFDRPACIRISLC